MIRVLTVVVTVLLVAVPVAAQTKVESFTTEYNASFGGYLHVTAYEFTLPTPSVARVLQEVLVDIYYNTRRVLLIDGAVQCRNTEDTDWLEWAATTADYYMASLRTGVSGGSGRRCQVVLAFTNNVSASYSNSPQSAAVRLNVSRPGIQQLTKRNPLDSLAGGAAGSFYAPLSDAYLQRLRARLEAATP